MIKMTIKIKVAKDDENNQEMIKMNEGFKV